MWLLIGLFLVQFGRFISQRVTCPAAGSSSDNSKQQQTNNSKQQQTNNRKQQTQPTPVLIFEGFLPHRHAAVRLWLPVSPTWQMWHWKSAMDHGGCLKWAGSGAQFASFMELFACLTTIFNLLEGLNNLFAYPNWVWWLTLILQPDTVGEVLLITWFFYGLEPTVIFHHLPNLPDVQISPWSGRDMLSPATTDAPSQVRGPDCYRHLPGHSKCWKETSVATNHWYLHSSYLHIFND